MIVDGSLENQKQEPTITGKLEKEETFPQQLEQIDNKIQERFSPTLEEFESRPRTALYSLKETVPFSWNLSSQTNTKLVSENSGPDTSANVATVSDAVIPSIQEWDCYVTTNNDGTQDNHHSS